jgi:large subunit ribosomal protein L17
MRHAVGGKILNRTSEHRLAMRRNLCQSLIEHGQLRTTIVKAKDVRAMAERLIQLAVDAAVATENGDAIRAVTLRQRAIAIMNDRQIIPAEHRDEYDAMSDKLRARVLRSKSGRRYRASISRPGNVKFTAESVIHRLFTVIGPEMKKRNEARGCQGGYTRVIKLSDRRLGDGGQLAILQIVGADDQVRPKNKGKTERRRKAAVRYAFYAGKPIKRRGKSKSAAEEEAATTTVVDTAEASAVEETAAALEAPAMDETPTDTAAPEVKDDSNDQTKS